MKLQLLQGLVQSLTSVQQTQLVTIGFLMAIPAIATAISLGLIGSQYFQAVARQPELKEFLSGRLIIIAGLIDAFSAISVAAGFLILFGTYQNTEVSNQRLVQIIQELSDKELNIPTEESMDLKHPL